MLTIIMTMTLWTAPVYAEGGVDVIIQSQNITVISGDDTWDGISDYTAVFELEDGYESIYLEAIVNDEDYLTYSFDNTTGEMVILADDLNNMGIVVEKINIYVYGYTSKVLDPETDITSVTVPCEETAITDEYLYSFKSDQGDISYITGAFFEADFTENHTYKINCGSQDDKLDTYIVVLKQVTGEEYDYEVIDYEDYYYLNDEYLIFTSTETGSYIILIGYYVNENYGVELKMSIEDYGEVNNSLDFTTETPPVPGEDDLWSWDADTKTLTLNDGFKISTVDCAIILPDGATVNVNGEVSVISLEADGICCLGDVDINMCEDANLNIKAGYIGIYTPTGQINIKDGGDKEGMFPVLDIEANYHCIAVVDDNHRPSIDGKTSGISISDCDVRLVSVDDSIVIRELYDSEVGSDIVFDNSALTIESEYYGIYNNNGALRFNESFVDISSRRKCIYILNDVEITDCETVLTSKYDDGIAVEDGDVNLTNGSITINAKTSCIETNNKLNLNNINFCMYLTEHTNNDILKCFIDGEWGEFIVYDGKANILHEGEMTDEIKAMFENEGMFAFEDENGDKVYAKILASKFNGDKEKNQVIGVEEEYQPDQEIEFDIYTDGIDMEYPVWSFTRFNARSWEILDTELTGFCDVEENIIDISSLEEGTYTLRVRFEQQIYQNEYWAYYTNPTDEHIDFIDIEFNVLAAEEEIVPPPAEDEPVEDEPVEDEPIEEDKTPPTGMENYGLITVIVALLGVMILAVKKNKKSAK